MIKSRNTDIKEIPSIDSLKHAEFKKCCEDARYFINEHLFKITPEQDTLLGGIVGGKIGTGRRLWPTNAPPLWSP